jgi:hypothetical protein
MSPSATAVVRIAALSDPASGSVIAIAAQRPAYFSSCDSSATDAIALLPRPWPGSASSSPTSPQHISMIDRHVAMFEPLRTPTSSPSAPPLRRTPDAPAPPRSEPAFMPSMTDASMSSSTGRSCSARSYLREIGRSTSAAT